MAELLIPYADWKNNRLLIKMGGKLYKGITEDNIVKFVEFDESVFSTGTNPDAPSGSGEIEEQLIGVINGVNKVFTTTYDFAKGTTKVSINGLKQLRGPHYTETDTNEVTFDDAPTAVGFADVLIINYIRG